MLLLSVFYNILKLKGYASNWFIEPFSFDYIDHTLKIVTADY